MSAFRKIQQRKNHRLRRFCVESLETRLALTAATLTVFVDSLEATIPANVGVDSSGNALSQVRTTDSSGLLDINPIAAEPLEDVTLGDFFDTWQNNAGVAGNNPDSTFNSTELLGNTVGDGKTVQMFVNGEVSRDFENYVIQDGDDIVLVYGDNPIVSLNTTFGPLIFELFPGDAPGTVENFLNYVNDGDFINSFFHRSADNISGEDFVIQGGGFVTTSATFVSTSQFTPIPTDPPIVNEPGRANLRGTIAMAKTSDPDSATSQFFVNLNDDNVFLDDPNNSGGFTVFGQVLDLTNADAIAAFPIRINEDPYGELPVAEDDTLVVVESIRGLGNVSGFKFSDTDSDGFFDATEQALGGETIFVDENENRVFDVGEISTTTANDGSYLLQVEPGTHTISTVTPAGLFITNPVPESYSVDVEIGREVVSRDFGQGPAPLRLDALDDSFETFADVSTQTFAVLTNDAAPAGTQITAVTQGTAGGLVNINGDQLDYVPSANFVGIDTFTYTIDDADGNSDTATVTVEVLDVNANSISGNVYLDHDGDEDRGSDEPGVPGVRITLTGDTDDGETVERSTLTLNDGSYRFDAIPPGTYTITQTQPEAILDGSSTTSDADASAVGNEISNIVLAGDEEISENNFSEAGVKAVYSSIIWFFASSGTDQNLFRETVAMAEDDAGNAELATLIREGEADVPPAANEAPIANDDLYAVAQDTMLTVAADTGVLANDEDDDGDDITATLVASTTNGTLSLESDGSFVYTPDADFVGIDNFTYTSTDGSDTSNIATATIAVEARGDGAPRATADTYDVNEDSTLTVSADSGVLSNDSDPNGDSLTASVVSTTSSGTLNLLGDGSFNYTPNADFNGGDTFLYEVSDGLETSSALVTINVTPQNDAPTAVDDTFSATEDTVLAIDALMGLLANDIDIENDPLTAMAVSNPQNGTLILASDGSFTYTPDQDFNGADAFIYVANDGSDESASGIVTINVAAVEDPSTLVLPSEFADSSTPASRNVGEMISFSVSVDDVDDSDYIFQLDLEDSGIPAGAAQPTIGADTGQFEWTPNAMGQFEIRILTVNGDGEANQETFLINII